MVRPVWSVITSHLFETVLKWVRNNPSFIVMSECVSDWDESIVCPAIIKPLHSRDCTTLFNTQQKDYTRNRHLISLDESLKLVSHLNVNLSSSKSHWFFRIIHIYIYIWYEMHDDEYIYISWDCKEIDCQSGEITYSSFISSISKLWFSWKRENKILRIILFFLKYLTVPVWSATLIVVLTLHRV